MDIPEPLATLLKVYERRSDLREVYPEAAMGDYARLIDWAAGVTSQKWVDSDFALLLPGKKWYAKHFTNTPKPPELIPWSIIQSTAEMSANSMPLTLELMQKGSDISEHLVTLYLLITLGSLKNIVELGVRTGNSTLAILEAARAVDGRVLSVDIEPCLEARDRVENSGLGTFWQFLQADDLRLPEAAIPDRIDFLFIDTNHVYDQALAELKRYSKHMRPGGWIALHDYTAYPGVCRAVHDFVKELGWKPGFFPFVNLNGLALLQWKAS